MEDSSRIYEEIGLRLREVRKSRNMTQQELAAKANIALPHISDVELGKKALKLATFIRIIEVLQVSADEILRADVPSVNQLYQSEFSQIIEDCTPAEVESLKQITLQMKSAMRQASHKD